MRKIYAFLFAMLAVCGLANAQVVFDFSTDDAYTLFGLSGFSATPQGQPAVTDGDITSEVSTGSQGVTVTVAPNPSGTVNRMWSGSLRLYGGTLTVSSPRKNITAIKFTLNSNKWGANNSADVGTLETGSWSGNASAVVITIAANTQIKKMEVYLEGDDTPTVIDWTSSADAPLTVAQVLEKGAQLDDGADSGKDVYVKGKISQITEIGTINESTGQPYGNATYSISDDGSTSNELVVFRGKGLNGADLAQGDIAVGDEVVVIGKIKKFMNEGSATIEVNQGNKLYSLNGSTGGDTPGPGPDPQVDYTPQGDGTLGSPYNIDAIRSMDAQSTTEAVQTEVWVKGVVFGYITSSALSENTIRVGNTPGEEVTKSNIVLIDENHNIATALPDLAYMGPVALPNGDVRDALNLGDNNGLIGQTIWVCGDVLKYMGVPGIKNVKKYSLDGTTILPNGDTPGPGPGPDPGEGTGDGTLANPYNHIAAISVCNALESGAKTADVYVKGKISEIKYSFDAEHGTATFFISDDGTATNQFQVYSTYYLGNRAWADGDTQIALGDEVIICGKLINYNGNTPETASKESYIYSLNGVTGGDTPEPEYLELPSIARAKAAATNAGNGVNAVLKADNLLVTYVNGKSVYVFDGTDGLLLFASNASTNEGIKTGDKITADVKGQIKLYSGLTELAVTSYDNLTVNSSNNTVTPQTATIADISNNFSDYENELVTIAELTPATEGWTNRNITFTDDSDNELVVRDNWNVGTALTFDTSKTYGVTGFVAIYATEAASTVQLYPRSADDFNGDTGTIVYPDPRETALDNPYSVAELRALNATSTTELLQEGAFVVGYIVGYINGSSLSETSAIFSAEAPAAAASTRADDPTVSASNFLLADDPSCTDIAAVVPINLANNNPARTDLNLKDNPSRLGTKVWLQGNVRKYMGVTGLHNVKHYSTDGVDFTGVQAVQADTQVGNIYTVAGQRVESMTKPGVYVVGGKKVMK